MLHWMKADEIKPACIGASCSNDVLVSNGHTIWITAYWERHDVWLDEQHKVTHWQPLPKLPSCN